MSVSPGRCPIPNYTAHTRTNCLLALPLIYLGFYKQTWVDSQFITLASSSFFLSTLLLSPDLDLKNSRPTKNWGILSFIWVGYHRLFRHRGKSHSVLLSTLTKLIYLSCVLFFILFFAIFFSKLWIEKAFNPALFASQDETTKLVREALDFVESHQEQALAILAGLAISDWIHIFTDKVYSAAKKLI
jgi:uncharacterized metal-binding protein